MRFLNDLSFLALLLIVAVGAAAPAQAETPVASPEQTRPIPTIQTYRISYTEIGKRARFATRMTFLLKTGSTGEVETLRAGEENERAYMFVVAEAVESCLRKWVLEPGAEHRISIAVTSLEPVIYELARVDEIWLRVVD